jgi:hypothetical protein
MVISERDNWWLKKLFSIWFFSVRKFYCIMTGIINYCLFGSHWGVDWGVVELMDIAVVLIKLKVKCLTCCWKFQMAVRKKNCWSLQQFIWKVIETGKPLLDRFLHTTQPNQSQPHTKLIKTRTASTLLTQKKPD